MHNSLLIQNSVYHVVSLSVYIIHCVLQLLFLVTVYSIYQYTKKMHNNYGYLYRTQYIMWFLYFLFYHCF